MYYLGKHKKLAWFSNITLDKVSFVAVQCATQGAEGNAAFTATVNHVYIQKLSCWLFIVLLIVADPAAILWFLIVYERPTLQK